MIETWVLIILTKDINGWNSAHHVPGIASKAACLDAAKSIRDVGRNAFAGDGTYTWCVPTREVVQPAPAVERK